MSDKMVPSSRPQFSKQEVLSVLGTIGYDKDKNGSVVLLGIRGYYMDTMGVPDKNDIGIYDDAIFLVSPGYFLSVNANVDPSRDGKKIAHLKTGGPYLYKIGLHNMKNPYEALRQYGRVTVLRDGKPYTDTASAPFYIDIHKGGYTTTSSLGCQTIHPSQWQNFLSSVKRELNSYKQDIIPYYLSETK